MSPCKLSFSPHHESALECLLENRDTSNVQTTIHDLRCSSSYSSYSSSCSASSRGASCSMTVVCKESIVGCVVVVGRVLMMGCVGLVGGCVL